MPEPELARLYDSLRRLRLTTLLERVDTLLQEAGQQDLTYAAFLDRCLAEEVASKTERQVTMRTTMARFPYLKTLEGFDFSFQPSIDRKKIHELAAGRFIEHAENVIFLGPPGTGKTHLAVAVALKAVQRGVHPTLPPRPACLPPSPRPMRRTGSRTNSSSTACPSSWSSTRSGMCPSTGTPPISSSSSSPGAMNGARCS